MADPCGHGRHADRRIQLASAGPGVIELDSGEEAPVVAARLLTGTPLGAALPRMDFRVATTRGTNALLEHKGARVALFITSGFEDMPWIRDQRRADLFQLGGTGGEPVWMMPSAGGLVPADRYQPKDSLLSGPAGGLIVAAELARAAGFPKVLTFDMGGTSTDVARVDGPFGYREEQQVGPARVLAPALKIETVAAGGGSVCAWRNGRLEIGPESAGANPGPACYGRGGPLTLTDVNLLLGLMDAGKAGLPLDVSASRHQLEELMAAMRDDGEDPGLAASLLAGLREIAVERMAEAIRSVSIRQGVEVTDHALFAFGGAGPQHACAVAERLGVSTVLIPADAGLLSAWGLERARRQEQRVRRILRELEAYPVEGVWREMAREAGAALGVRDPVFRFIALLRLHGQEATLELESEDGCSAGLREGFSARYRGIFGYDPPADVAIELLRLRVVAEESSMEEARECFGEPVGVGPLLWQDPFSTCVVPPGWQARRGDRGTVRLESIDQSRASMAGAGSAVAAGLFRSRFEGILDSMGEALKRSALSTNIRERLDFSCALLDAGGRDLPRGGRRGHRADDSGRWRRVSARAPGGLATGCAVPLATPCGQPCRRRGPAGGLPLRARGAGRAGGGLRAGRGPRRDFRNH